MTLLVNLLEALGRALKWGMFCTRRNSWPWFWLGCNSSMRGSGFLLWPTSSAPLARGNIMACCCKQKKVTSMPVARQSSWVTNRCLVVRAVEFAQAVSHLCGERVGDSLSRTRAGGLGICEIVFAWDGAKNLKGLGLSKGKAHLLLQIVIPAVVCAWTSWLCCFFQQDKGTDRQISRRWTDSDAALQTPRILSVFSCFLLRVFLCHSVS